MEFVIEISPGVVAAPVRRAAIVIQYNNRHLVSTASSNIVL